MARDTILHLRATNFFGGPERQILGHAMAGGRFAHHVASFAEGEGENELAAECAKSGLPASLIPAGGSFSPGQIRDLRALVKKTGARIVCTHGYKPAVLAALALPLAGAKLLPFARGHTGENAKVAFFEVLERRVMARAQLIVAVSGGYADYLAGRGLDRKKIRVVRNAIDARAYASGAPERNEARKALGLSPDEEFIVTAGRLSPEKGHEDLLLAFARISGSFPRARLALLGDGPERERLETRARALGLSRVSFYGFRKDAPLFYSAMDLFALPSRSEGLPNVVLEAFAFARPVVATRVGGVPEVVEEGRSGRMVPPGRPEALARALESVLSSPDRGAGLGEEGRKRVVESFGFEAQARALEEIYGELLGS